MHKLGIANLYTLTMSNYGKLRHDARQGQIIHGIPYAMGYNTYVSLYKPRNGDFSGYHIRDNCQTKSRSEGRKMPSELIAIVKSQNGAQGQETCDNGRI